MPGTSTGLTPVMGIRSDLDCNDHNHVGQGGDRLGGSLEGIKWLD